MLPSSLSVGSNTFNAKINFSQVFLKGTLSQQFYLQGLVTYLEPSQLLFMMEFIYENS